MDKARLQKIIADSGFCSRRKAEAYIKEGRVNVNGRPAKLGDKASLSDIITVKTETGSAVKIADVKVNLRYIKMYKPRGVLCSMSDPHAGTKTLITDLTEDIAERVYPIGRLDANSEGLILLTNDGNFANKIAHPRGEIKKTYRVTVPEKVSEEKVALLASGVEISKTDKISGRKKIENTLPCSVEVITSEKNRTVLLFAISEGKNRQIRRMCEAVGLTVSRLKRISIGKVKLGMLKPGEYADLTAQELRLLGYDNNKTSRQR
ncbi:MAG: rRNA pseudouridine synthase [Oscillospiraceae bacterium]|nr:rRNA pseudouridine synthase [Oscillospiraceae bacterium]